jgi:macrolide-specific efflux system membrane fusion protein
VYYNGILDVPNPDGKLRISMTTEVNIVLGEVKSALTIPATALNKPGPDGRYRVRVLGPEQRIETHEVRIGMNNKVDAEVLDGLKEGDQVVIGEATGAEVTESSLRRGPPPMM